MLLSDGYMSVTSPESTSTTACPLGSHVPLPANGALYVQNGATQTCGARPWVTDSATTHASNTGGTSYPLANDTEQTFNCYQGDLFIEGTLKGTLDVGAANNIYVTGNLTYANGLTGTAATDGLGLVADNYIVLYHPIGQVTTPAYCSRGGSTSPGTGETQTQCATKKKLSGSTYVTCTSGTGCAAGTWVAASTPT